MSTTKRPRNRYKVTLTNGHAMCSHHAFGRTMIEAYRNARAVARDEFLYYKVPGDEWRVGFAAVFLMMHESGRKSTSCGHSNSSRSVHVQLERA